MYVLVSHLYVFFGEMCLQVPFPLFDWVVRFYGIELYKLLVYFGNYFLSIVSLPSILSHSDHCLFTLFVVTFVVQKLLSLVRSHFFIFVFISITPGGGSQKILALIYVMECSAYFPLKVL